MRIFSFLLLVASFSSFANTPLPNAGHVAVSGVGEVMAEPDMAEINLTVKAQETSSLKAKQEVDGKVNKLLSGLAQFAIGTDDVSASDIRLQPKFRYDRSGTQQLEGYSATRSVKLKLKQLSELNKLVDYVLSVPINQVGDIALKSSKHKALMEEARLLAVEDARSKAKTLARAFGRELGAVYSIGSDNVEHGPVYGNPGPRYEMASLKSDAPAPGQYLQEKLRFSARLQAVFLLQ